MLEFLFGVGERHLRFEVKLFLHITQRPPEWKG
jgi:hypothetical protein